MSEKLNIEKLISSRLGEAEINPSPGAWKGIQRKLRWNKFLHFRPGQFNIFYLGGLLITGAAVVTILSTNTSGEQVRPVTDASLSTPSREIGDPGEIQEPAEERISQASSVSKEIVSESPTAEKKSSITAPPKVEAKQQDLQTHSEETETDEISAESHDENLPVQNSVITYFTSSVQSGCAPLTVRFTNQSVNESSSYWTFGADEIITDRNPVYQFKEPGIHAVVLTAESSEGQLFTHRQVIEVFPAPKADFEIEEGLDGIDGLEALSFMNYSAGAYSYSWNLVKKKDMSGENWTSNEFQPSVSRADVEQEAHYIRLLATNEYGCTDTSIQALPFSSGPFQPDLRYPTAFSPNPNGPGGGIYSPHEIRNDLFHPVFESVPDEYLLTVYSRNGELVFKTRDIYQGWDGYYQQEQTSAGVYLWIAEGKWSNGQEFRIRGDVTLLWSE